MRNACTWRPRTSAAAVRVKVVPSFAVLCRARKAGGVRVVTVAAVDRVEVAVPVTSMARFSPARINAAHGVAVPIKRR